MKTTIALLFFFFSLSAQAAPDPIYITVPTYPLILTGQIELNYQAPYLWIRFITAADANSIKILRYCYKVLPTQPPATTNGWMTLFNYWLGGPWKSNMQPMTPADVAWCWQ